MQKIEPTNLFGITPVFQCLLHGNRVVQQLWIKDQSKSPRLKEILNLAQKKRVTIKTTDAHTLANLAGSKMHQGVVLSAGPLQTYDLGSFLDQLGAKSKKKLIALDQIEDPQNLGAIIRTAAFLGADGLITLKKHAAPLTATVSKASAGALEYFPVIEVNNLSESLQQLQQEAFLIVGAALEDSIAFQEAPQTDYLCLVVGNEGQGLRKLTRKRCDHLVHIPGNGSTESLNVSAASAILIQHFV